jgi:vancomycin aglycone glucosyltransferase
MRVLVVADGTRGDVQPMCVLGSTLQREGHAITMAAPPGARAMVQQAGLDFVPLAMDSETVMREIASAVVAGPRAVMRAAPRFLLDCLDSQMRVLPELVRQADFVLAGGMHLAVPSLSERYQVPWRWVVYSVTLLPSSWHPPMLMQIGRAPRIVNWLGWHASRWLMNRLLRLPLNAARTRLGMPALRSIGDHLLCPNPIVAIDPELAPLAPEMRGYDVIGHLAPDAGDPLPEELERFLADGPPPLYVGFGSMTDPDAERTTELALEARRRAGCRLLLSRGWAGFGQRALPSGCMAIGPVSHSRLFPRVAGIVHHGGAGTTAAAARSGKPQLIIPHLADQFHFGAHVHTLGVAPKPLRRMHLSPRNFTARIDQLLHDEAMRERAQALAESIASHPRLQYASRLLANAAQKPRTSVHPQGSLSVAPGRA